LKVGVSGPRKDVYGIIDLAPTSYAGPPTKIQVEMDKGVPDISSVKIPKHLELASPDCYVPLDKWHKLACTSGAAIVPLPDGRAALAAAWGRKDAVALFLNVRDAEASGGAWRRFAVTPVEKPEPPPAAPPSPDGELAGRCLEQANADPAATEANYVVCVDALADREQILSWECTGQERGRPGRTCKTVDEVVRINRHFVIYVWRAKETVVDVTLGGTPGTSSMIHQPGPATMTELKSRVAPPAPAIMIDQHRFGPRKAGSAPLLLVLSKPAADGKPATELQRIQLNFTVEEFYRFAIRLGLDVSWAPLARTVAVRSTPEGQRYADITEGQNRGLVSSGLVAGVSYFFCEVPANSTKATFAVGLRLGVLDLAGGQTKTLNSLMVGPELALGPDFSLGLFGGIIRHDTPIQGQEPGKVLRSDATVIDKQIGFTPGFSIVMNFTPGFLKTAGLSQ
jgi:hypothetical protein